jgi:plasmid maintenance system killer protein
MRARPAQSQGGTELTFAFEGEDAVVVDYRDYH